MGTGLARVVLSARSWRRCPQTANTDDPIHELTRTLTDYHRLPEILALIERSFTSALGLPIAIFLPEGDRLSVRQHSDAFAPRQSDLVNAARAMSSGHLTTYSTSGSDTCSCFLPLTTWRGTLGAIGFRTCGSSYPFSPRTQALIESFANQTSLAILRVTLEERARSADALAEADRLQTALLNSIAHNVRTPLSSIIGVLSTLQEEAISISQPVRRDLIDTARQEAERLNRLLGNLLDLSRLEAGAFHIRKDPCDVQDVIGAALEQLGPEVEHREIKVTIAQDLPFIPMDFVLIVQVLVNLLDNALKYSFAGTSITMETRVLADELEVRVSDQGTGIAEADLCNVFEKFNRGGRSGEAGGVGLGLSICKGLIEAHHGTIRAERRQPQGTTVAFTLPIQ